LQVVISSQPRKTVEMEVVAKGPRGKLFCEGLVQRRQKEEVKELVVGQSSSVEVRRQHPLFVAEGSISENHHEVSVVEEGTSSGSKPRAL
jgi:hypothetical protein